MTDYVICISNADNPASLILGKVYRRLPDAEAEAHDMLRVVDEDTSEPDGYLYPVLMFGRSNRPSERWQWQAIEIGRRALSKTPDAGVRLASADQLRSRYNIRICDRISPIIAPSRTRCFFDATN